MSDKTSLKRTSKKRLWLIRLIIFIGLILLVEIFLRIIGFKPGVMTNHNFIPRHAVVDPMLYGDSLGISHYTRGNHYKPDGIINAQGFLGNFDYDTTTLNLIRKKTGKKIVMIVGDSFTDGCCSDSVANSFCGLLNQSDDFLVLNFGVAGTDPLQYKLITEYYATVLKPDLLVTVVYLGNDIMSYQRTSKPFIPACYIIKGGQWYNSEIATDYAPPNSYFKTADEAISFNNEHYTLRGTNRNFLEKMIGKTVIFSRLYLYAEIKLSRRKNKERLYAPGKQPPYTLQNLRQIDSIAVRNQIPNIRVAIPPPQDVIKKTDLKDKYAYVFGELTYHYCSTLNRNDYNGRSVGSHFNNKGHKKFAAFLEGLINEQLKTSLPAE
jgi:lysophospholipase L1-like esterase